MYFSHKNSDIEGGFFSSVTEVSQYTLTCSLANDAALRRGHRVRSQWLVSPWI